MAVSGPHPRLFLVILAFFTCLELAYTCRRSPKYRYPVHYLESFCRPGFTDVIPLNDKASQLYLSRTYGYHPNMNCKVTIRVPLGEQVIATFREISIRNSYRCNDHRLEILDGPWNSTKKLSGPYGLCGSWRPTGHYQSSFNEMTFHFTTNHFTGFGYKGFKITITASRRSCRAGDFRCRNSNCISDQLKCDGYDNCGDLSDESTDLAKCRLSGGAIAGIVLGVLFCLMIPIIIIVICCSGACLFCSVLCCCCRKPKREANRRNVQDIDMTQTTAGVPAVTYTTSTSQVMTSYPAQPPPYTGPQMMTGAHSNDAFAYGNPTYTAQAGPFTYPNTGNPSEPMFMGNQPPPTAQQWPTKQ